METGEPELRAHRRRPLGWVLGGAVLVAAWAGGGRLPSFGALTYAVVGVVGVVALVAALWPGLPRPEAPRRLSAPGWQVWVALFTAFGVWEVWALLAGDDPGQPTLSDLLDPLLLSPDWRGLFWVAWLVVGWGLVRR
ncbi:hypothetical protein ACIBKY_48120 [Nonomuraea sp. NPDC050394]|uniref:hypothetical protein n=1 Tax=Nonomuraea sp. NPDC050394 TaxID=3364363 RepID=UPI0037AAE6E3